MGSALGLVGEKGMNWKRLLGREKGGQNHHHSTTQNHSDSDEDTGLLRIPSWRMATQQSVFSC